MQAVRELERRLTATVAASCTKPARPSLRAGEGWPGEGYIRTDGWDRMSLLLDLGSWRCSATSHGVSLQLMDMNGKPLYIPSQIPATAAAYRTSSGCPRPAERQRAGETWLQIPSNYGRIWTTP